MIYDEVWQRFAVSLAVRSVGVQARPFFRIQTDSLLTV